MEPDVNIQDSKYNTGAKMLNEATEEPKQIGKTDVPAALEVKKQKTSTHQPTEIKDAVQEKTKDFDEKELAKEFGKSSKFRGEAMGFF
jgi:hypothetical protein